MIGRRRARGDGRKSQLHQWDFNRLTHITDAVIRLTDRNPHIPRAHHASAKRTKISSPLNRDVPFQTAATVCSSYTRYCHHQPAGKQLLQDAGSWHECCKALATFSSRLSYDHILRITVHVYMMSRHIRRDEHSTGVRLASIKPGP
jgi:hypothetical protein